MMTCPGARHIPGEFNVCLAGFQYCFNSIPIFLPFICQKCSTFFLISYMGLQLRDFLESKRNFGVGLFIKAGTINTSVTFIHLHGKIDMSDLECNKPEEVSSQGLGVWKVIESWVHDIHEWTHSQYA